MPVTHNLARTRHIILSGASETWRADYLLLLLDWRYIWFYLEANKGFGRDQFVPFCDDIVLLATASSQGYLHECRIVILKPCA
jgi:hypothetical protein